MRVLIADHDSTMLEATARALRNRVAVDIATSKAICVDLLRANDYDVLIACERLDDGSGLELLSQADRRWPEVLRVLAIEPARLALLSGRLGPFRLFHVLRYPIDHSKLVALLARVQAAAADDAQIEEEEAAPEPAVVAARTALGYGAPAGRPPRPVVPAPAVPTRVTPISRAHLAGRTTSAAPASLPRIEVAPAISREELASLAATIRPGLDRPPPAFRRSRTLPVLGAGLVIALAAGLAVYFYGRGEASVAARGEVALAHADTPARPVAATPPPAPAPAIEPRPELPPEVSAFVSDLEAALLADDLPRAREILGTLREIAPEHPRLALFEALILRAEEAQRLTDEVGALADEAGAPATAPVADLGVRAVPSPARVERSAEPDDLPSAATTVAEPESQPETPGSAPAEPAARQEAEPAVLPESVAPATVAPAESLANATPPTLPSPQTLAQPLNPATAEAPAARLRAPRLPVITEARLLRRVSPEYPREALREGIEGLVELRYTVTSKGKVADVEVVHADPPGHFDRAAIAALRRWQYSPRLEDGVAVDSRTRVRLEFKLEQ